jgi:hypothetical protein
LNAWSEVNRIEAIGSTALVEIEGPEGRISIRGASVAIDSFLGALAAPAEPAPLPATDGYFIVARYRDSHEIERTITTHVEIPGGVRSFRDLLSIQDQLSAQVMHPVAITSWTPLPKEPSIVVATEMPRSRAVGR